MRLGELIAALENIKDQDYIPEQGFCNPHSYRGDYEELAFEPAYGVSVAEMLNTAKRAVGATFCGWKGGYYTMGLNTLVNLAVEGYACGVRINEFTLETYDRTVVEQKAKMSEEKYTYTENDRLTT